MTLDFNALSQAIGAFLKPLVQDLVKQSLEEQHDSIRELIHAEMCDVDKRISTLEMDVTASRNQIACIETDLKAEQMKATPDSEDFSERVVKEIEEWVDVYLDGNIDEWVTNSDELNRWFRRAMRDATITIDF